jgi:hypothetical protein
MKTTAPITIFEGPDCSGKTTAAKAYAEMTGALYVHAGAMPRVTGENLFRAHMESMMPALLGIKAVVLDRFHKSEAVYGELTRGTNRLTYMHCALLDRAALRCGAVQVNCMTSWDLTKSIFNVRRTEEMLDNDSQLRLIWNAYGNYGNFTHNIPELEYDFTTEPSGVDHSKILALRTPRHAVGARTAGNLRATNVVVFSSSYKPVDSFLHNLNVLQNNSLVMAATALRNSASGVCPEYSTLWVDAAELTTRESFTMGSDARVFHFGDEAYKVLHSLKIESIPL